MNAIYRRDGNFNVHYIIKLDSYEPWSFKRRHIFRIYLSLENLLAHEHLQTVYCVLCVYLVSKLWVMIKKLIVKADENTRKYLAQYEASMHDTELAFFRERAAARERERQREGEERANRRAKAEKERERSHGRENRERELNFVPARESIRESYILDDKEEEQRRQLKLKEKLKWKLLLNGEKEDGNIEKKQWQQIVNVKQNEIRFDSGQEEYYKDRSRWWFHRQQTTSITNTREAMEAELNNEKDILTLATIGASQNNSVKPELTLNLASKRRAAFMALAEDEEFDD
ncbi:hypothetical protein GLOIN_2v1736813 [Rhizophagus irregularis DAOM 181602=DAOM 197198]|nr:hypothetical protein GLOIN_2v1736813 [Rhizophagus irregularis DAOM 181602=DAOM 197198]